jgi:hypothetical protein
MVIHIKLSCFSKKKHWFEYWTEKGRVVGAKAAKTTDLHLKDPAPWHIRLSDRSGSLKDPAP